MSDQDENVSTTQPGKPSQATDVNSTLEADHSSLADEQATSMEDQGSGLGVMGTTAVSVGAILAIVALGTFVVTRRHP
jgi:hypothetical protein